MSSKSAADRRAWSLAARLTAWYAGSAFALLLAATGYLYWALGSHLDREDDDFLADRVGRLRRAAARPDADAAALRREVEQPESPAWRFRVEVAGPPGFRAETPGTAGEVPEGAAPAGRGDAAFDHRSGTGRYYRVRSYRSADGGVSILAAMDRQQDAELLEEYRRHLAYVLGLGLFGCGAVGYGVARRGLRPVRAVAATAGRVGAAHFTERIAAGGLPAELRTLADAFNAMLDRLEGSFDRLGRFTADIAHELRTPVNNLRGEFEVALSRERSPAEYRDALGSGLEECGRMGRTIESLLFLARAENPRTQVVADVLAVLPELRTVAEFYEAAAGEAGVRLTVAPGDDELTVAVNRPLFQRAVGNVVANALAHTPAGGSVTLSVRAAGDAVEVVVADTGVGIPPEHLPRIFERFYRADPARPSAGGSVGLGLSIVRGVVELHGGRVAVESEVGRGTRVGLIFPRPPSG